MPRDARFWRNVTLIAVAHIAIVAWLVRWNQETRKPNSQNIVWMSGAGLEAASRNAPAQMESTIEPAPEPDSTRPQPEEKDETPALTPAKSDIQLPIVAPSPTPVTTPAPRPSLTPVPKPSPKPTAKPSPKPSPKKLAEAKATPRPSPKKSATPPAPDKKGDDARKESVKVAPANSAGEKSGSIAPGGGIRASEFSWYGKMLHDRFYSEWVQPTTSVAIGTKISALVRIRIETDGRISKFTLVRPSGNVVVDESVAAVAARVTQVDPLPKGLGSGASYEVNINFELNPEQ